MKKSWWLLALMLGLPIAYAVLMDVLEGVWQKILSAGDLSFIGISGTVPFTRILIWILCFTLFFAVASVLSTRKDGQILFKRTQAIVVASSLSYYFRDFSSGFSDFSSRSRLGYGSRSAAYRRSGIWLLVFNLEMAW